MILCSASIQVSPDLVVCSNLIRGRIYSCFFTAVVLFLRVGSFLLLELASAYMTQILSDKFKMIDSESKMETPPQGLCLRACVRVYVCLRMCVCACVHSRTSALSTYP